MSAPPRCLLCGATPAERHHPTGRTGPPNVGRPAPHAHPRLTVLLCRSCHDGEHAVWRALDLADTRGRDGDPRAAALLCLRRLAVLAQRIAERRPDLLAAPLAALLLARVGDGLHETRSGTP